MFPQYCNDVEVNTPVTTTQNATKVSNILILDTQLEDYQVATITKSSTVPDQPEIKSLLQIDNTQCHTAFFPDIDRKTPHDDTMTLVTTSILSPVFAHKISNVLILDTQPKDNQVATPGIKTPSESANRHNHAAFIPCDIDTKTSPDGTMNLATVSTLSPVIDTTNLVRVSTHSTALDITILATEPTHSPAPSHNRNFNPTLVHGSKSHGNALSLDSAPNQ